MTCQTVRTEIAASRNEVATYRNPGDARRAPSDWHALALWWERLLQSWATAPLRLPSRGLLTIEAADCGLSDRGRTGVVPVELARAALAGTVRSYGFADYQAASA